MKINTLLYILTSSFLCSCATKPTVSALCEKDTKGNYILKWEIFPEPDNTLIEIYSSYNDSIFPSSPKLVVNSNNYIAVIADLDTSKRAFFRIKTGGTTSGVITNRFFNFDSVQNFRDMGGYYTNDNRQVRWGKLFRAGTVQSLTAKDKKQIQILNIKTIIDLRGTAAVAENPNQLHTDKYLNIAINTSDYEMVAQKIRNGQFLRGDAVIYEQDMYKQLLETHTKEYADFFDYLCNADYYPIVYSAFLGKDQVGIASYFLLRALDVPTEVAEDDYKHSRRGIERSKLLANKDTLSEAKQEALTMFTNTDVAYLKYGLSCIRRDYHSVEEYMTNELKLTPEKRKKLRSILLY